ncbi:hypothetical protein AVEN_180678-1 [Araneus ventricosus]|uniref:Uncharacterized protein n=1 Tax=Araneus ventricosus TaxID=182803 RepID=A0A4Y2TDG9_ARAVE|nr:hypothetical protein AVEN_56613-1 [Araneus ventricosus]GBN98663.1 hypothetical protein AVEN_180678-1 [Araneus ventricosus]
MAGFTIWKVVCSLRFTAPNRLVSTGRNLTSRRHIWQDTGTNKGLSLVLGRSWLFWSSLSGSEVSFCSIGLIHGVNWPKEFEKSSAGLEVKEPTQSPPGGKTLFLRSDGSGFKTQFDQKILYVGLLHSKYDVECQTSFRWCGEKWCRGGSGLSVVFPI